MIDADAAAVTGQPGENRTAPIAAEIGVGSNTVRRARKAGVTNVTPDADASPVKRTGRELRQMAQLMVTKPRPSAGRDGKKRSKPQPNSPAPTKRIGRDGKS